MPIRCTNCAKGDMEQRTLQLTGTIKGKEYTVEMAGLECPVCKHKTLTGQDMTEFGRLLADKYRAEHGLLTSKEIIARRTSLNMSQEAFARFLGDASIASVKRWELGKIQDKHHNALILQKTSPQVRNSSQYQYTMSSTTLIPYVTPLLIQSGTYVVISRQESPFGDRIIGGYRREGDRNTGRRYAFGPMCAPAGTTGLNLPIRKRS